jgi:hypothetical protein
MACHHYSGRTILGEDFELPHVGSSMMLIISRTRYFIFARPKFTVMDDGLYGTPRLLRLLDCRMIPVLYLLPRMASMLNARHADT